MEANKIEALLLMVEQGESHNQGVHSDVAEGSIDNFDELLLFDDSEFDMYNLPVLPSLRLSPPPVTAIGIDDTAAMSVINSFSPEESSNWGSMHDPKESDHAQNLSIDSDFIAIAGANDVKKSNEMGVGESNMDRSSLLVKRAISPEKLAELAKVDPKKAKRILANRKSAAKSKERRTIYAKELQERVNRLKVQADNITEQLTIWERNTAVKTARNNELRMQIEAMQQQLQQRRAHNEALRKEIEYYKMKASEFDAEMADDPSYGEMLSKIYSQLALRRQFPNPPPQHQAPLQPQLPNYLPDLSYETNNQMPSGFDQNSYTTLPPLPPSLPAPSLPYAQHFNDPCGPSFSNFNQLN